MATRLDQLGGKSSLDTADTRFDWAVVLLSGWMVGGIHLDAWAHHRIVATLETFFTPWHAVLYSGFFALAALLMGRTLLGVRGGRSWRVALPAGYGLSLLGTLFFLVGGVGDLLWHLAFGIEVDIEALLSPTHLLLALGAGLMVTGPVRATWARREGSLWPALVSLAYLLSLFTFFTAYASPISDAQLAFGMRPADPEVASFLEGKGVAAILLQTLTWMGVTLLAVRRWRLPFGGLSAILGLSSLLTLAVHEDWFLLPAALLAGLLSDFLYCWLKPSPLHMATFRLLSFALPVLFYALYFLALALVGEVWWRVHLWAGAIVLAGIASGLLSYAFLPPGQDSSVKAT